MVNVLAAVVGYTAISTFGLMYNMDEVASLQAGKLYSSPTWISSVGPKEAEAARAAAALLIGHCMRSQFLSVALLNWACSVVALWAMVTKEMFLGQLTMGETANLTERLVRFVMIKAVFVSAVVGTPEPADLAMWLAWCSVVAYMKGFVGLARDRSQVLLASPSATAGAHLRTLCLLCLVLTFDLSWVAACASAFPTASLGQLFLWLHDTALIFIEAGQTLASYAVYGADRYRIASGEAGGKAAAVWEGRGEFQYHVDAGGDIAAQALTLAHLAHIWFRAGFGFNLLDLVLAMDVRAMAAGLLRKLRSLARHRAAASALRSRYPDAPTEQLAKEECAICRDVMQAGKVLPCSHVFHCHCLSAWLTTAGQSNFTCPICRTSLLAPGPPPPATYPDALSAGTACPDALPAGITCNNASSESHVECISPDILGNDTSNSDGSSSVPDESLLPAGDALLVITPAETDSVAIVTPGCTWLFPGGTLPPDNAPAGNASAESLPAGHAAADHIAAGHAPAGSIALPAGTPAASISFLGGLGPCDLDSRPSYMKQRLPVGALPPDALLHAQDHVGSGGGQSLHSRQAAAQHSRLRSTNDSLSIAPGSHAANSGGSCGGQTAAQHSTLSISAAAAEANSISEVSCTPCEVFDSCQTAGMTNCVHHGLCDCRTSGNLQNRLPAPNSFRRQQLRRPPLERHSQSPSNCDSQTVRQSDTLAGASAAAAWLALPLRMHSVGGLGCSRVALQAALQEAAVRLHAGRCCVARQAGWLGSHVSEQLSAAMVAVNDALLDGDYAAGDFQEEVADSGALATRLLEACMQAGLGGNDSGDLAAVELLSGMSDSHADGSEAAQGANTNAAHGVGGFGHPLDDLRRIP